LGEFFIFMLILFGFGWGSAFLAARYQRYSKGVEGSMDQEVLARLLEDMDQLSTRLSRIEEDVDFFRDLRAPEAPDLLTPPDDQAATGEG
jgi:hypothetical protein